MVQTKAIQARRWATDTSRRREAGWSPAAEPERPNRQSHRTPAGCCLAVQARHR